ncbi:MAG: hypothetical protein HXS54_13165, partial [Theionarchaea archaeon]|nr:hypothetical protein [Theionarchaea archaeon]
STLVRSSKLIFVNKYRFNKGVNPAGVWGEKRYWVPKEYIENNVFYYFKQRFSKIVKAKKETNNLIGDYSSVNGNCHILNQSATDLSFISDCSVDYCFTDPPYGGTIQYLGLSTIWNAWLGDSISIQREKEIVMNKEKGREEYRNLLRLAFKEIYRVLKHGRYMSVTFHSSQVSVWNALVEACGDTGFDIVNVIPQKPLKKSHNQMNMTGTVKTDLIITFRKPVLKSDQSKTRIKIDVEKMVLEEAFSLLKRTSATTAEIYDRVVLKWIDLVHRMPLDKKDDISLKMVFDILKENFKSFYEKEKDYKGEYRKILKWTLPDQRKGKGKEENKNMGDLLDFEI